MTTENTDETEPTDPESRPEKADGEEEPATTENGSDANTENTTVAEVSERIENRSTEATAEEITDLRERLRIAETDREEYEARIETLEDTVRRKQAEFENYKRRSEQRREDERERATEDLVTRLLDVRDNLGRALDQEEGADIRPGVESTLAELDRVLDEENVAVIEPEQGTEVDPQRHEVMLRVDSDRPEGTIAELFQAGYEMSGKVLRPAQVTVSE